MLRYGSLSALRFSHASGMGSNPHLDHIFFIFHKVFAWLGIRLGLELGLVFLG